MVCVGCSQLCSELWSLRINENMMVKSCFFLRPSNTNKFTPGALLCFIIGVHFETDCFLNVFLLEVFNIILWQSSKSNISIRF